MDMRINAPSPSPAFSPTAPAAPLEAPPDASQTRYRTAPEPLPLLPYEEGATAVVQDDGEYGAMPWDQAGEAEGGAGAPTSPHQASYDRAAELGMPPEGLDLMRRLEAAGHFDKASGNGRNLAEEVCWRIEHQHVTPEVAQVLMRQILDPDANIMQAGPNTCVAATAQKAMATTDPHLYFVTAADMVNAGGGWLPDGKNADISPENRAWIAEQGLGPEQMVDATFQAALMDFANGEDTYSLATDKSSKPDGTTYDGLNFASAARLNQSALGAPTLDTEQVFQDYNNRMQDFQQQMSMEDWRAGGNTPGFQAPAMMDVLLDHVYSAQRNNFPGIMVAMQAPGTQGGMHMVLVQNVDTRKGQVTFEDATGRERTVPYAEFTRQVAFPPPDALGGIGGWTGWTPTPTTSSGRQR